MNITDETKNKMSSLRQEVFGNEYNKKVVGVAEDCTNQELIKAVMGLEVQLYLKDTLNEIVMDIITHNDITEGFYLSISINSIQ